MPETIALDDLIRDLLQAVGHDTDREGLQRTPARVARFYREFLAPVATPVLTTFDAEGTDEMVVIGSIPFYSLCEHHLLPFFGTATWATSRAIASSGSRRCRVSSRRSRGDSRIRNVSRSRSRNT